MTNGLAPYPAMKDSGVPWLGPVPEHWGICRIKTLFREKDERSRNGSGVLLSLTKGRGLLPQSEASNRLASAGDLSKYKVCEPGDLVMNRMQAWSGMFAVSEHAGLVSPDYSVFSALKRLEIRCFEHLFKTPILVDQFAQASKGIGSGFNRLYTPDFGAVPVAVPPVPEQAAIVRFLDHADGRIRRYIRANQKLIKLLEEQKQAIIHRAVTRGLDPNVRLKPSGVEWLGEVPEHWEVSKFKRKCRTTSGATPPAQVEYYSGTIPWIRSMDLTDDVVGQYEIGITERAIRDTACKVVPAGSVLIAMYGGAGTIGKNGLLAMPATTNQAICAVLPCPGFDPWFVLRFVQASRPHWMEVATGARVDPNISQERIRDGVLLCPPLEEQRAIASATEVLLQGIRSAVSTAMREVDLLREYRTSLIAEVVTGKLDVRDAAARLLDESADAALFDEDEASTESGDNGANEGDAGEETTPALDE